MASGHRQAAERGFERNLPAVDLHGRGPVQGQGDLFEHPFGELHHPEVVLVGYVNLHNGKFGVVRAVHAFVAEVLAEFIHAVEASYDQLLEVQLAGDAQVLVDVERVVVGNERTCRRTARNRLQNRGFDFDVPELVEIFAHRGDDLRTLDENLAYVGIHDQIDVALAVTDFWVGEGVEGLSVLLFHDGQGRSDLESRVSFWQCTDSSPVLVRNAKPSTPTMSPMSSSFLNTVL